jgi:putative thiamine transport system permease protein
VGAGRHATITTEALTLAAGGQRTVMAAFALMQALLPAAVFVLAAALARWQARRIGTLGAA